MSSIKDRKKGDFKIGQELYCLQSTKIGFKIKKITIENIGRKYLYFDNKKRHEFGSDWVEYYCGSSEWRFWIDVRDVLDTLAEAEDLMQQRKNIDKITDNWQVRKFLQSLSKDLVHQIYEELQFN
jgi:hypothetical protein